MIKRINKTKTIAAPDTPELHIYNIPPFFIFSHYFMEIFLLCDYLCLFSCNLMYFLIIYIYSLKEDIYEKETIINFIM